jgi:hypothetical protein
MKRRYIRPHTMQVMLLLLGFTSTLIACGAAGAQTMDDDDLGVGVPIALDDVNDFWTRTADGLAWNQYVAEGAEVVPWTKALALPNADNAALLYYQAFLLHPEHDATPTLLINDVLRGAAPDGTIRVYLGQCRGAIHVAELASQIPQCTWGLRHGDNQWFTTEFLVRVRQLAFALAVDARTLAADGHYQPALTRCLTMRRLAHHLGGDTHLTWAMSTSIDAMAGKTIQHVLGTMPPDSDTLIWLRAQLATVPGAPPSLGRMLRNDTELIRDNLETDPGFLDYVRRLWIEANSDDATVHNLTDEELIAHIYEPHARFVNAIDTVLDSTMTYAQKYEETERLLDQLQGEISNSVLMAQVMTFASSAAVSDLYAMETVNLTWFNTAKTAVEVYLVTAESGELPEALPAYVPKDPFSGQDFLYEITPDGFLLRCQGKDLRTDRVWEYEFTVCD